MGASGTSVTGSSSTISGAISTPFPTTGSMIIPAFSYNVARTARAGLDCHYILQALPCPVVSLQPLVQRLSADLVPYRRLRCVSVFQKILYKPLTCVCFLCYPVHAENLPRDGLGVVTLFYHLALCFHIHSVTHLLYQNTFSGPVLCIPARITSNSQREQTDFHPFSQNPHPGRTAPTPCRPGGTGLLRSEKKFPAGGGYPENANRF